MYFLVYYLHVYICFFLFLFFWKFKIILSEVKCSQTNAKVDLQDQSLSSQLSGAEGWLGAVTQPLSEQESYTDWNKISRKHEQKKIIFKKNCLNIDNLLYQYQNERH